MLHDIILYASIVPYDVVYIAISRVLQNVLYHGMMYDALLCCITVEEYYITLYHYILFHIIVEFSIV